MLQKSYIENCELTCKGHVFLSSYSGLHLRINKAPLMLCIGIFQDILTESKSAVTTCPSWLTFTTADSFSIGYCITQYLKGYQKYDKSKLKVQSLLSKFRCFNFDLSYFYIP